VSEKKYRPNVAAVILSSKYPFECKIFIANRNDYKNDIWQFPQGGIDEGETPKEALFRELKEEIGTDEVEIIAEFPQWLSYDFPPKAKGKMYPFDGQTQKYFLVKLKRGAKINLATKEPEFREYRFVEAKDVLDRVGNMKKDIYKEVLTYFKRNGYI
jgi:putative (di)nucleoside polyphosphate hydrolase